MAVPLQPLNRFLNRGILVPSLVLPLVPCLVPCLVLSLVLCLAGFPPPLTAQSSGTQQPPPIESGGPDSDTAPYAIPHIQDGRRRAATPPPAPTPDAGVPPTSITVEVPLVTLNALVLTKDGQFIPGLQKEQFRVLEDNVEQPIQSFSLTHAGYTAVLLVEFASNPAFQRNRLHFLQDALRASYVFTDQMQKDDNVSVIAYDIRPEILVDFTTNKQAVYDALSSLRVPLSSDSNLFDALNDTLDRLERIEGRKEIILIGSGSDTFSRMRYDKLLNRLKSVQNITIYTISTGFLWRQYIEAQPGFANSLATMDYLQADNQMETFARMTGGRWYSPRMQGELPDDFRQISAAVRNQYTLSYTPTNPKLDGTYRKLRVMLVDPGTTKPLQIRDARGKEMKYQIITRDGYTARHAVE
jgi:VWFA-related protein